MRQRSPYVHNTRRQERPPIIAPYERHAALGVSDWYLGHLLTWLASSPDTGGRLWLAETVARRGEEPPVHVHQNADELF